MKNGFKTRLVIHKILFRIYTKDFIFSNSIIQKEINPFDQRDRAFITNVVLSSMRNHIFIEKVIKKFLKKKMTDKLKVLLISSITQLLIMDIKEYAVVNTTVDLAKKINLHPGLVNALLKNIINEKIELKKIKITFKDLPIWLTKRIKLSNTKDYDDFLNNINRIPKIHIVFKRKDEMNTFQYNLIETSEKSGFIEDRIDIFQDRSFDKGEWWVQDFSSFLPLYLLEEEFIGKKVIDLCAAPGGKSFQILAKSNQITLNDINKKKLVRLKSNLERLNYKAEVLNEDALHLNEKNKFDFIILDAPCTSIGTIRKNPDILFKKKIPSFEKLIVLQKKLLKKSASLLNKNGIILYMVCSFFNDECENQIENFLKEYKNFKVEKFNLNKIDKKLEKIIYRGSIKTLPTKIGNYEIDGFFATCLKRIDN